MSCPVQRRRNSRDARSGAMSGSKAAIPQQDAPADVKTYRASSMDQREERRPEEDDQQRRQNAEGQRQEHEHWKASRGRLSAVTFGQAEGLRLQNEQWRERRSESRRG